MVDRVVDPKSGREYELQGNRWVPVSTEQAPEPAPKLTSGAIDAALISAGDVFTNVGRNARDVYAMLRGDEAERSKIQGEREEADVLRGMLHEEAPIAATVGGMAPGLLASMLTGGAAAPSTLGSQVLRAAATNAGMGALQRSSGDYL